ncbi:unnamed protein product [Symbiodinium sp. CCMP2592]|nr:unnamed protein product [Symbiodinium sp. CCMP2592]
MVLLFLPRAGVAGDGSDGDEGGGGGGGGGGRAAAAAAAAEKRRHDEGSEDFSSIEDEEQYQDLIRLFPRSELLGSFFAIPLGFYDPDRARWLVAHF